MKTIIKHEEVAHLVMKTYEFLEQIGEGSSSRVYRAYDTSRKGYFAIKVIPKSYLNSDPSLFQLVKNEIEILKSCSNSNVVKCLDVFQTTLSIFIVTELCNGCDMDKYLESQQCLSEDHAVMYLKQMLNGFKGLHDMGVMHRDFKLANVLLSNQLCKIADLGYAKKMSEQQVTYTLIGTYVTMAPEVLERKGYSYNADIWSLGVVFYQMLFGAYPFVAKNEIELQRVIKLNKVNYDGRRISMEAKDFIERCLTHNPKERIKWNQVYNHPLIQRPHMQILYGIHNLNPTIELNSKFYDKNLRICEEYEGEEMAMLRQTSRKKLVIEQIHQIISKKMETPGSEFKPSQQLKKVEQDKETDAILFQYANEYARYFNKLSCVFKFVNYELIGSMAADINKYLKQAREDEQQMKESERPKIAEIESLMYLIYKKAYCEMLQYQKIVEGKINIFKIPQLWGELTQTQYYKTMSETIGSRINNVQHVLKWAEEQACLSHVQEVSADACEQDYQDYSKISLLCEKYVMSTARELYRYFKHKQVEERKCIDFMEGLLYYLISDERSKPTPEQFDWKLGTPHAKLAELHHDLAERFQLFFNFL